MNVLLGGFHLGRRKDVQSAQTGGQEDSDARKHARGPLTGDRMSGNRG